MDFISGALVGVGAIGGAIIHRIIAIRKAKKEVQDVIRLAEKLIDKYKDVDEDAAMLQRELFEAVIAVKKVFSI